MKSKNTCKSEYISQHCSLYVPVPVFETLQPKKWLRQRVCLATQQKFDIKLFIKQYAINMNLKMPIKMKRLVHEAKKYNKIHHEQSFSDSFDQFCKRYRIGKLEHFLYLLASTDNIPPWTRFTKWGMPSAMKQTVFRYNQNFAIFCAILWSRLYI